MHQPNTYNPLRRVRAHKHSDHRNTCTRTIASIETEVCRRRGHLTLRCNIYWVGSITLCRSGLLRGKRRSILISNWPDSWSGQLLLTPDVILYSSVRDLFGVSTLRICFLLRRFAHGLCGASAGDCVMVDIRLLTSAEGRLGHKAGLERSRG